MSQFHTIDLSIFGLLQDIADNYSHNLESLDADEIEEALSTLDENEDDFTIDFDGNEYRIIYDAQIWDTYVKTIKDVVNDSYDLKLDKLPSFIAVDIDWDQTATNCFVDGYGHTFASYDGEELNSGDYWVFRVN